MRKLISLLVLLPIAIVLIVLSVANRHSVVFNLDPINPAQPFLSLTLPFFVFLFAAVLTGMVIGSLATWFAQGKHRKMARTQKRDAVKWQHEAQEQKVRADSAVDQMTGEGENAMAGSLAISNKAA